MRRLCAALAVALSTSVATFAGDIRIVTDPEGAEVSQDSMQLGVTTKEGLRIVGVEPGVATFTISKPGFETVTKVVTIESATEPMTVLVRLRPVATPEAIEDTQALPNPAESPVSSPVTATTGAPETAPASKQKRGSNPALIILGGAALVGGGVALASGHGSSPTTTTTTTTLPRVATLADLTATVTSPQNGAALNCNESAYFTVGLTNAAPALVRITGVRLHTESVVGDCTGVPDFTYAVTNSQIGTGTANVLTNRLLFSGGVGCCSDRRGCSGSCSFQFSFVVLTSVGEVPAGHIDFGIVFKDCPICPSLAGFRAASCPAKR